MTRYIARAHRPKADWWGDQPPPQTITHPTVSVGPPVDTGLVDHHGLAIYRFPDEIGFLPRREHIEGTKE